MTHKISLSDIEILRLLLQLLALLYILAYQWNIKIEKDDKKC